MQNKESNKSLYYVPTMTTTYDYEKLFFSDAFQRFVVNRESMSVPINVFLPNSKLYITVKTIYEFIALDILLSEHDSSFFCKPLKIPYYTLKGQAKVYSPDFMILRNENSSDGLIEHYYLYEVPDFRLGDNSVEYRYKLSYAKQRVNFMSQLSSVVKYDFTIMTQEFFIERIKLYQKNIYLSFFEYIDFNLNID